MRLRFNSLAGAAVLLVGGLNLAVAGSATLRVRPIHAPPKLIRTGVTWSSPHHAYVIFGVPHSHNYYIKEISLDKKPTESRKLGGPLTRFCQLDALAVGPGGNLYVSGFFGTNCQQPDQGIEIFASGAYGNVAPIAMISGSKTLIDYAYGMAFDTAGNLYAVQLLGGQSENGSVNIYAAGATGNVAPMARLVGPNTLFGVPYWVAVDDAGEIFVGQISSGSQILKFPPGANGNVAPTADVTVEPFGHGFNELRLSGNTLYAAIGDLRQQAPSIYELSTSNLVQTGALTNPQFTILGADVDSAGKIYVQDFHRTRGNTYGRGRLFEYEPESHRPFRVRRDGNSSGGVYIVVGP